MKPVPVMLMARELNLGGSERQLTEIARALDRSQFEPHVGCFRAAGLRAAELRAAGVPVVELPVHSFASPSVVRGALAMGRYIRRNGIRLVHTFDSPLNIFGVPAARAFGVPAVLSSQRAHRDLTPGLWRHMLRLTDQLVDAVVVNCMSVGRQLVAEEKVPAARVRLCYNGVDTAQFRFARGPRPAAVADACVVIGVVCALRPEKDLGTLVDAFAKIRHLRPGLKLVFVGSGPERDALATHCRELGLTDQCHFEPATAQVAEWLRGIDIFVLPSRTEALSNSLMEAMASGCCAVASQVGGNPELVEHGRTGLLFPSGDAVDLVACLRLVLENDELRNRLAEAGAQRMRSEFSLEMAARRMAEIYDSVLNGGLS